MLNVQIVLFDGFDLLDAIAPYEVFCAAGMTAGGGVHVEFVSADGPRHVISGVNGVKLEARGKLSPDQQGIILVPGASGELAGNGAMIGDPNASKDSSSFLEVKTTANASTSSSASPSLFEGEWDATIETPVGGLIVKLHIATVHGVIQGTCIQGDEVIPFIDPEFTGNLLRWSLRVTKPMRLTLKFEVVVDGDQMTGTAKAGVLPSSRLSGHRI